MKLLLASDQTLDPALQASYLARRLGRQQAEIDVLTVIPGMEDGGDDAAASHGGVIGISEGAREYRQACAHVASLAAQLQQHGFRNVRTHVEYGDPAEVILASSRQWRSQLLLIGSPRRRGLLTAFRLDGITRRLLRWADCAVELIRPQLVPAQPDTVLLPLTIDSIRHLPLQQLQSLPGLDGCRLHLLGIVPPGFDDSRADMSPAAALLALQHARDARGRAQASLAALAAELQARLPAAVTITHEVAEGSLRELCIRSARTLQPSLIMLAHDCMGEPRSASGAVATAALALAVPCSLLLLQDAAAPALPQRRHDTARILKLAR